MAAALPLLMISSVIGSAVSAVGTIAAGNAQADAIEQQADFEAKQLEIKAKEEKAAAQRDAFAEQRKKNLAQSALTARAAGSGFSATDPGTLDIAGEISRYGTYNEQMAMYGGRSRSAGLRSQAEATLYQGATNAQAAKTSSYFDAASTIIGGASNLAKYQLSYG